MSEIDQKHSQLRAHNIDLGRATGAETLAGSGGRKRNYQRGTIYFHPNAGAHYVSGGMQGLYEKFGGPGRNPKSGRRDFGYPTGDPTRSADGAHPMQMFEFGSIHWVAGTGGVYLNKTISQSWRVAKGELGALGHPVSNHVKSAVGEFAYFERGLIFRGAATNNRPVKCEGLWPLIGKPEIVGSVRPGRIAADAIRLRIPRDFNGNLNDLTRRIEALWTNKLLLKPSGGAVGAAVHLHLADQREVNFPLIGRQLVWSIHCDLPLKDRTLYDLMLLRPDQSRVLLSPNCVYAQDSWSDCAIMHVSDLHASRRTEGFRGQLTSASQAKHVNYNNGIRAMISSANRLHRAGKLDAIMATGDLVDYVFEHDENREGTGNFGFLVKLLTGGVSDEAGRPGPKLRVPIFMSAGNHDYRVNPYDLFFDIDVPVLGDPTIKNYGPHNLTATDAKRLQGGKKPTVSRGRAQSMVAIDKLLQSYSRTIAHRRSYAVRLGGHTLVMIDSRWDAGILDSIDAVLEKLGFGSDDERNFAAGHPNSVGIQDSDIALLKRALDNAPPSGSVIVGLHAPPINTAGNEYPYYFRETMQAVRSKDLMLDFHRRQAAWTGALRPQPPGFVVVIPKGWQTEKQPYFKKGGLKGMDIGVSKGKVKQFLDLCAGKGAARKADLVLSGHVHKNIEYRLQKSGSEFLFFTDFYFDAPREYYSTKVQKGKIHISVRDGAPVKGKIRTVNNHSSNFKANKWKALTTPPYADPLNSSRNKAAWWRKHAPLIVQTACLGPIDANNRDLDEPSPAFRGYRLIKIEDGNIGAVTYHLVPPGSGRNTDNRRPLSQERNPQVTVVTDTS